MTSQHLVHAQKGQQEEYFFLYIQKGQITHLLMKKKIQTLQLF